MKFARGDYHSSFDQLPSDVELKVAAIYEDFGAGIRVREALEWLGRELGPTKVVSKAWNFSMLARLDVRAAAIHEAADTDMFIVAATADQKLPVQVMRWIERCLIESHNKPAALVALHEDGPYETSVLTDDLRKITSRWRMDYIGDAQLDDRVNVDYIGRVLHRRESVIEIPVRPSKTKAVSAGPQRERLAEVKMGA